MTDNHNLDGSIEPRLLPLNESLMVAQNKISPLLGQYERTFFAIRGNYGPDDKPYTAQEYGRQVTRDFTTFARPTDHSNMFTILRLTTPGDLPKRPIVGEFYYPLSAEDYGKLTATNVTLDNQQADILESIARMVEDSCMCYKYSQYQDISDQTNLAESANNLIIEIATVYNDLEATEKFGTYGKLIFANTLIEHSEDTLCSLHNRLERLLTDNDSIDSNERIIESKEMLSFLLYFPTFDFYILDQEVTALSKRISTAIQYWEGDNSDISFEDWNQSQEES